MGIEVKQNIILSNIAIIIIKLLTVLLEIISICSQKLLQSLILIYNIVLLLSSI